MVTRILLSMFVIACLAAQPVQAACNIVNGKAYGDCAGVTVNTGRAPFSTVSGVSTITGISEGAHVLEGGSLDVSGIADRVIVDWGGRASVTGIVDQLDVAGEVVVIGQVGQVHLVDGGAVTVEGIVGSLTGQGSATLIAGSVIAGVPTESTHELTR